MTNLSDDRHSDSLHSVWRRLHVFCEARGWRGYDPYDGLNSPVARLLPGKKARQAWTQFHRRSPVNFRPLCGIEPTLNATAVALFALGSGDVKLLNLLESLRNADGGWGYPFDWQSRALFAPRGTSNLICTAFAAKALKCDVTAFVEKHLLRDGWITYIAGSDTQVHNVNMIGAALLGRRDCMEFSVRRQRPDGSWWYGEAKNQRWIDNFHTGYCLVALKEYEQATGDKQFADCAGRGYEFWRNAFWRDDAAPRYYHDRTFPLDIHCCAQGIVTFLAFGDIARADEVAGWALRNMWDERGYFWYQRGRLFTNRLCYMRWAQAWMYYALATLIEAHETANR